LRPFSFGHEAQQMTVQSGAAPSPQKQCTPQLHRSRPSLRHVLPLLFLLLAAIPAGAIGMLLTDQAWNREFRTVREQHLQLAINLAGALTRYAADVAVTLQLVSSHLESNQPVVALTSLLDRLHFSYACLAHRSGRIEHVAAPNAHLRLARLPHTVIDAIQTGPVGTPSQPVFSSVLSNADGAPMLIVSYAMDKGRFAIGVLQTHHFTTLQSAIRFGLRGHAVIVDRLGRILAHPNVQWQQSRRDVSELEPVRGMLAGKTGVAQFVAPQTQTKMIAGFTAVPHIGWGVMVPQPLSELEAPIAQARRAIWSVIGIALLSSAVLGWLVSHWLAAPLQHIGEVATRFANGMYDARVNQLGPLHTDEAATLAVRFNNMANEVNRSWQVQRASEERFRDFAQTAADWFWETDSQQIFTYIAPTPESGRNWNTDDLLGQHRREHVYNDPDDAVTSRIQAYMNREEPFTNIEFPILGRDGQPIYLAVAGKPMHDSSDTLIGYRGVARDITDHLQTEAQLRQARRAEELREAQKMEAIGTLAGGIAHDFNNILGVILGFSELTLYEVAQGSVAWHNLQQVLTASRRAKDLVRQILTFSRKDEQARQPLQLHLVIHEALKMLRASLPTTIDIRQELAEDSGAILADPTQMQQVLMNLCSNAEYAMRDAGGILEVRLDNMEVDEALAARHPELLPGPYVRLTVRDTGVGMEEAVLARLFEPFYTTKSAGDGTGMGLAVVHGIVTSHGGAIAVDSTPGQGATFTIYLPQIEVAGTDELQLETPVPQGKGQILFIDDDETLARLGQRMLERLGYDVVAITSSIEALETFRRTPEAFDLIVTDQTMPQMTGEVLARELRQIRSDMPIILCTGFSHVIDADKAAAQGIDAFLLKPLIAKDLGLAIQQVLAQGN
jgi:PAS domain S-box-containing protein